MLTIEGVVKRADDDAEQVVEGPSHEHGTSSRKSETA